MPKLRAETPCDRAETPTPIPPGEATLADVLEAVDAAIVAGDLHRARRLLAEAKRRAGETDAENGGARGR